MESLNRELKHKRIKLEDVTVEDGPIIKEEAEESRTFKHFNASISDFSIVVTKDDFVDKSLLIRDIFKNSFTNILITAPHRFGKSTNMSMLKKFIEIHVDAKGAVIENQRKKITQNYKVFQEHNLLIFQDQQFFNQYFSTCPVIYVNFSLVDGESNHDILNSIRFAFHNTFIQHRYLLNSINLNSIEIKSLNHFCDETYFSVVSEIKLQTGLKLLSECLYKHFNRKIFLIIDDYDGPINNVMFKENIDIRKINHSLSQIIAYTFQNNIYIERAVLTGITSFASIMCYGSSNIKPYTFLDNHQFTPYQGLTELEVNTLLNKFQIDNKTQEQVKKYYGHYLTLSNLKLYPIWSILHFLKERKLENYWYKSILNSELKIEVMDARLQKLCEGQDVFTSISHKLELKHIIMFRKACLEESSDECFPSETDVYLSFLLTQGYLSYFDVGEKLSHLRIVNDEVESEFKKYMKCVYRDM